VDTIDGILNTVFLTFADRELTVGQVFFIPAILIIGYAIARWIGHIIVRRMTARNINPDVIHLVRRIYLVLIVAILAITVLEILNVPLGAFAFISGAVAIGIGFGAQNVINNFISGWILMWERPIRIGDFLEVGEHRGTVEAINTRSTRIRRVDGVHMLIPNSFLLENTVVNWTLVDKVTRTVIRVGVVYGSPTEVVKGLIYQAVRENEQVLSDPNPIVIFEDFGDSALIFDAYFWVEATQEKDLRVIRSDIRFRIVELFQENGIVIAFPQLDVHLDSVSPVEIGIQHSEDTDDDQ